MPKEGKARVLTSSEFKRIITQAKDTQFAHRNIALIYCSFGLGLRAKEITSLKVSDLFDENFKILEEVNLTRSMTKGEKQRHIYINNSKIIFALNDHIKTMKHGCDKNLIYNDNLFKTQRKSKIHTRYNAKMVC